jgi:hypothetical protein
MTKSSVREYAILYVGKGGIKSSTAGGGNVILNAGQHALDGPEHTGDLPADRVSVEDVGGYYTGDDAEAVLQELGAKDAAIATVDFLVGTASGSLSTEIVVGTTPGGELGGTWPSPTVDSTHSGSSHAATQAAAEATAAAALAAHVAAGGGMDHEHIDNVLFSGDGSTTAFELPAAPFDEFSVKAYVAGVRSSVTLSGVMLTTCTFGSAPASGTDNVLVDIVAAVV